MTQRTDLTLADTAEEHLEVHLDLAVEVNDIAELLAGVAFDQFATTTDVAAEIASHDDQTAHGAVAGTSKTPVIFSPSGTAFEIYVGLTSSAPFPTASAVGALFFRPA